jgi:hypothetical protein
VGIQFKNSIHLKKLFFMGLICSNACLPNALLANPTGACIDSNRVMTPSRLWFFPCNVDLPSPLTCANIQTLIATGQLVMSNPLANWNIADPETEDIVMSECLPAVKRTVGRTITLEDRFAVQITTGSPATVSNAFFDYDFWVDKLNVGGAIRVGISFCDGKLIFPRATNGTPMQVTMQGFISHQKPSKQGGGWIEFKKINLDFSGDPLFFQKPDLDLSLCGIPY